MKEYKIKKVKILIEKFINKYYFESILLAISGGQDSTCLIKILKGLRKKNLRIVCLYIDHQWQNCSSKQIKHIINYIKLLKISITIYQIKKVTLSEDECRKLRYSIMIKHGLKYKNQVIITGHNSTDQVETFIQKLVKGNEIEGLNSLSVKSNTSSQITILRPLIILNRTEVLGICKTLCLPIWSDNSNYIYNIQRNRIRHELIPYIKKYFHQKFENNIKYLLKYYYYQNEYIKQSTIKLYIKSKDITRISIHWKFIKQQNFFLQMKIIQVFCFHNLQIYVENKMIVSIIQKLYKATENIKENIKYRRLALLLTYNCLSLGINI
uniref:tRNA(Ile)-lysidine synthase, chloroplastic n=1 Tax=Polysiphonia sp. TaxID=1967842 RepID=A0A1Z1MU49_9FLOR|nr:tRNA Ile-lysidine synthetase [Polysiphonia sp.]